MKEYFHHLRTVEEIKAHYRALARKYHPDLGGSTETMQEINRQYHAALESCDGQTSTDDQGRDHTYRYQQETEQSIIDKISELFASGIPSEIRVYVIGLWIWVMGTTREDKDTISKLKKAECKWSRDRSAWYWRPYKARSRKSQYGLGTIAAKYGCREAREQEKTRIQTRFAITG